MASFAKRRTRGVVLGRLALLALSIVLMLGLSECAIRVALPPSTFRDHDSDAFWILRLREVTPMERMHADETLFDAALGWRAKPGFVRGNVQQNSRGVRGAREHDVFAGAGTRRIVTLGDSFTWGFGVGDDETYSARLEALLPATEVINLGVNGYGTDQQVLAWEREGVSYRPDLVVLGFFVHDFHRNGQSVFQYPKPFFIADPTAPYGFHLSGVPVVSIDEIFDDEKFPVPWSSRLADATRFVGAKVQRRLGWFDPNVAYAREVGVLEFLIERLARSTREHGVELLVVVIPARAGEDFRDAPFIEATLVEACARHSVAVHSLTETFEGSGDTLYDGTHWNADGHALAATALAQALVKNELLAVK